MPERRTTSLEPSPDTGHAAQRARLLANIDAAGTIPGIDPNALSALAEKLVAGTFNLVVAGEFKRGKSSVINALLGADVLPTGVVPLTSVVTVLQHGATPAALVAFEDGTRNRIALAALPDYVTEHGNPRNEKHVRQVEVTYPAAWLGQGIRLVDTPGIGSAHGHNSDVTRAFLPQADAVIFVASVDQPVSASELAFLADIRSHADRVFCLLNKIDHLSPAELAQSLAFVAATLHEALDADVPLFPVSARGALEAWQRGTGNAFEPSGFARLNAALQRFLAADSDEVLVHSVHRHLARLLAACRLTTELEHQALAGPLASLEANLRAFAAKKTETLQQRSDFAALLEADTRRLLAGEIEPAIGEFKHALVRRLDGEVATWVAQAATQRDTSPQAVLEHRIVDAVRRAFDAFRKQEDIDVTRRFDEICARFQHRIHHAADELMAYSATLFSVRFEAVATQPLRGARSHFYYKFWHEPDSMGLLAGLLTRSLPRSLQRVVLQRRAHRRVAELVEIQAGRMRHDLADRLIRAMQGARRDMLGHIDATIDAIERAVARGRELKSSGEEAATMRHRELDATLARIDQLTRRDGA